LHDEATEKMTLLLERPSAPATTEPPPRPAKARKGWIAICVALAVFATGLGAVVRNEVQANTQFDGTHRVVDLTRQRNAVVSAELASANRSLLAISGQVGQSAAVLASDTARLSAIQSALAQAQQEVVAQGSTITDLRSCLGGVEQALNALTVGDQSSAVKALNAVAASCQGALGSNG
jgi:chromosome segregation ATPase